MCLAIPAMIVAMGAEPHLATVEVSSVRRTVNIDLLKEESLTPGDWVLIHVGFAMSRISSRQAEEQLKLLRMLGEDAEAMQELEGYTFE
jgi:hydrogenase expression/formation protein HypC